MGAEDVELIRRGYAAWNAGDVGWVVERLDEEVEWLGHPMLPEPGPHRGREAVERWLEDTRGAWEAFAADPVAVIDAGDAILALVRMAGRGRGSGVEVAGGVDVHVWTMVDGTVKRLRMYQGEDAAELAGLTSTEREVLRLRLSAGMDDPAIAERLGIPEAELDGIVEEAMAKWPRLLDDGRNAEGRGR